MIYGYSNMSLVVIVSLCSFHRKILVVFPLGPMTSLVLGLINSTRDGNPFHGVVLNFIKKWLVGYFHNICCTLHKRGNFSLDLWVPAV